MRLLITIGEVNIATYLMNLSKQRKISKKSQISSQSNATDVMRVADAARKLQMRSV